MSLKASPTQPATGPPSSNRERTFGERRRRVWRGLFVTFAATVLVVALSISNRSQQAITSCRERMEYAVRLLQERYTESLRDPSRFPLREIAEQFGSPWRDHVLENWRYTEQAASVREVGVCCCEQPHARPFGRDGRHVILFNVKQQRFELVWLDEEPFQRRAEALGLAVRVRP